MKDIWRPGLHGFGDGATRRIAFLAYCAVLAAGCLIALAVPDRIFVSGRMHDVVIFVDGIYRVGIGQVPHLDFVSPLGAFIYWWPQVVGKLPGLEATLPDSVALLSVLCIAAAAWLSLSRLNLVTGVLFVTLVGLLVAAPIEAGGTTKAISFAMYYNRIGYAMLLLPLLLVAPATGKVRFLPHVLLLTATALVVLHLKITYVAGWAGIVLVAAVLHRELRPAVFVSLALVAAVVALIALALPGFYPAYLHDVAEAGGAKGFGAQGASEVGTVLTEQLPWFAVILWAAVAIARDTFDDVLRRRLFVIGIALILFGSMVVFIYNVQSSFLVLPEGLLLVLAATGWRIDAPRERLSRTSLLLVVLALMAVGPELSERASALGKYYRGAQRAKADYPFAVPVEVSSRLVVREKNESLFAAVGDDGVITVPELRAAMTSMGPRQEIYQEDYLYSIARGVEALRPVLAENGAGPLLVMDYSNPFSALLHLPPASGDYLWYHNGVNVAEGGMRPAAQVFADVKYVMVPQIPARIRSRDFVWQAYGGFVSTRYRKLEGTGVWEIWIRR